MINIGVILEKSKGMPLQKWYSLNSKLLYKILCENEDLTTSSKKTTYQDVKKLDDKTLINLTTSNEETAWHDVKKLEINNNKNNNKINNNKYFYDKKLEIKDSEWIRNAKAKFGDDLNGVYANDWMAKMT